MERAATDRGFEIAQTTALERRAAFALFASIIPVFLGASAAPTPLYPIYREAWGFSPITITVVFGIYALVVLGTLLVAGSLSDYVGRKPVLTVSVLLQLAGVAVFATAGSVGSLIFARVLQGLSAGAATGAVGAALLDLHRERGTMANAIAPTAGTALGGVVSGLVVAYLPAPTVLVFVAFGAVLLLQAVGLYYAPETAAPRPGALAALRPRLAAPRAVRGPLLWATPAMIAAWAIPGFYGSLGPLLLQHLLGARSPLHGGLALFVLAGSGIVGVVLSGGRTPHTAMRAGAAALALGSLITWSGIALPSVSAFFVGTIVAGLGFGGSFQGAVRCLVSVAPPEERAAVLSVLYVIAYLALGVPAVLAGFGVVYGKGLPATSQLYMLVVMLLAVVALVGTYVARPAES